MLQKKKAVIKLIILFIYKTDLIRIRFDFDELESPIHVFNQYDIYLLGTASRFRKYVYFVEISNNEATSSHFLIYA